MEYHFAPDFLDLVAEALAHLNRSKDNVLVFFQSAGVPARYLEDLKADIKKDRNSHSKRDLARIVLIRLNDGGDKTLRERREIVKRVVEFEDFGRLWPDDVLKAKGLVSDVQKLVNVKDSFTRMRMERDQEKSQAREARDIELREKKESASRKEKIKKDFYALFAETDNNARGIALEGILNRLFAEFGILIRESFVRHINGVGIVEQIDGVIELDGHIYLVEMKWWAEPLGVNATAQHLVRVFSRSEARGLFISASGYTAATIAQYEEVLTQKVAVLSTLQEIVMMLENGLDLVEFLRKKIRAAVVEKRVFHEIK